MKRTAMWSVAVGVMLLLVGQSRASTPMKDPLGNVLWDYEIAKVEVLSAKPGEKAAVAVDVRCKVCRGDRIGRIGVVLTPRLVGRDGRVRQLGVSQNVHDLSLEGGTVRSVLGVDLPADAAGATLKLTAALRGGFALAHLFQQMDCEHPVGGAGEAGRNVAVQDAEAAAVALAYASVFSTDFWRQQADQIRNAVTGKYENPVPAILKKSLFAVIANRLPGTASAFGVGAAVGALADVANAHDNVACEMTAFLLTEADRGSSLNAGFGRLADHLQRNGKEGAGTIAAELGKQLDAARQKVRDYNMWQPAGGQAGKGPIPGAAEQLGGIKKAQATLLSYMGSAGNFLAQFR